MTMSGTAQHRDDGLSPLYPHILCIDPSLLLSLFFSSLLLSYISFTSMSSFRLLSPLLFFLFSFFLSFFFFSGTLRFIVEFGSGKEMWSGRKVRKYCRAPVRDEGSSADFVDDETYPPTLPSGTYALIAQHVHFLLT